MNKTLLILFLVVPATDMPGTYAQEPLSMEGAVRTALAYNQTLQGASHDVEAARWGKLNAITNYLPKVEISSAVTRIDPESEQLANAAIDFIKTSGGALGLPPSTLSQIRPFAYRDTWATQVTVVQPIYNGGAEFVGIAAADALNDRSNFDFANTEQDVIARTKIAYYTVLKAEEMTALAAETVERTRKHLELTRKRADLGMRTHTDVSRFEVALANEEGLAVNAENGLAAARLQLNEVMGVDLTRRYVLEKPITGDSVSAYVPLNTSSPLLASLRGVGGEQSAVDPAFLDIHPSMQAMYANLRLAEVNVDQAWVNFKPRVNLAFQYGWEKNDTPNLDGIRPWAFALSVSLPVFSGFGDYTRLQRVGEEYKRTEFQVETFRRGLLLQASTSQLAVRSARKRIEIARKAQADALEVFDSVTRRYESGGASNADLMDVQTAYIYAKASYISAVYDYYIAEVQFARATGKTLN